MRTLPQVFLLVRDGGDEARARAAVDAGLGRPVAAAAVLEDLTHFRSAVRRTAALKAVRRSAWTRRELPGSARLLSSAGPSASMAWLRCYTV